MIYKTAVLGASVLCASLWVCGIAGARPHTSEPPCRISKEAAESVALEESLTSVVTKLGCPGALRSVEVLTEDLAFQTRVWMLDVMPYGELRGEFINGQLHGMTKAWLDLSVNY